MSPYSPNFETRRVGFDDPDSDGIDDGATYSTEELRMFIMLLKKRAAGRKSDQARDSDTLYVKAYERRLEKQMHTIG